MNTPIEGRILQVLQHLGITQAHFAARMPADWQGLVTNYPEVIASLNLIAPSFIRSEYLQPIVHRLQVFSSDLPLYGDWVAREMQYLPDASHIIFPDYQTALWADLIRDRGNKILMEMLSLAEQQMTPDFSPPNRQGEIAGITYEIYGAGEPLVLFPLGLAPSGWEPLIESLSVRFCVIVLGGPQLGMLPLLEERGHSDGYTKMMRNLFDAIALRPQESILEVGCGTGVVNRWLAQQTDGQNPITGLDLNAYLLKEATALVHKEKLTEQVEFREGNAEDLPFPNDQFDVVFSTTVMEEVNADKMLAEMIRVTKPGGRVGVIVRAMDMPYMINLPLSSELKAKFEDQPRRDEGESCASVSLYRRFQASSLVDIQMGPYLAIFCEPYGAVEQFLQAGFITQLPEKEATAWRTAIERTAKDGTFFLTWPHHCAVGIKAKL